MAQANDRYEPDYSKGNIVAFKNLQKKDGDKQPAFRGRLNLPGIPVERAVSLWVYTSPKSGRVMLSGNVAPDGKTQIEQMAGKEMDTAAAIRIMEKGEKAEKDFDLEPNDIVLFTNTQHEGEDPNKPRPDFFGSFNPGNGQRLMTVGLWQRNDRHGNVYLRGNLKPYEPNPEKAPEAEKQEEKARSRSRARSREPEMAR